MKDFRRARGQAGGGRLTTECDIRTATIDDHYTFPAAVLSLSPYRSDHFVLRNQETTGVVSTPDGKNLFVNFQHPGDRSGVGNFTSNWPDRGPGYRNPSDPQPVVNSASPRPRSATIVITREDRGVVGL